MLYFDLAGTRHFVTLLGELLYFIRQADLLFYALLNERK